MSRICISLLAVLIAGILLSKTYAEELTIVQSSSKKINLRAKGEFKKQSAPSVPFIEAYISDNRISVLFNTIVPGSSFKIKVTNGLNEIVFEDEVFIQTSPDSFHFTIDEYEEGECLLEVSSENLYLCGEF